MDFYYMDIRTLGLFYVYFMSYLWYKDNTQVNTIDGSARCVSKAFQPPQSRPTKVECPFQKPIAGNCLKRTSCSGHVHTTLIALTRQHAGTRKFKANLAIRFAANLTLSLLEIFTKKSFVLLSILVE